MGSEQKDGDRKNLKSKKKQLKTKGRLFDLITMTVGFLFSDVGEISKASSRASEMQGNN